MNRSKLWLLTWIPVIAIMAAIFAFSAENAAESTETSGSVIEYIAEHFVPGYTDMTKAEQRKLVSSMQNTTRKCAHAVIYFALSAAFFIVYSFIFVKPFPTALAAWLSATVYAATDEVHQLFVPGRACELTDILIDSSAALIAAPICALILALVRRRRKKRSIL